MRYAFIGFLAPLLAACVHTNGTAYAVHLDGCIDPQTAYVRSHVGDFDALGGGHFVMDDDPAAASAAATFTVVCDVTTGGTPGELNLDTDTATIDPAMANGELAFAAVFLHEGTHWQIHRGPHPERAKVHICFAQGDLGDPALCWSDHWQSDAVMLASFPGIGPGNGGWNADATDEEDQNQVPNFVITWTDQRFFAWAVSP